MSPSLGRNTDSPPAREHQKASGLARTNRRHLACVGQTRLNRPDGSGHHGAHGDVPCSRSAAAHVLPLRHRQPTTLRPQMPASASIRRASGIRRQADGTWSGSVANLKNLGILRWLQSLRLEARHCPSTAGGVPGVRQATGPATPRPPLAATSPTAKLWELAGSCCREGRQPTGAGRHQSAMSSRSRHTLVRLFRLGAVIKSSSALTAAAGTDR